MCHPRRSPGSPRRPLPAGQADAVERQARSHRVAAGGHARATTRCRGRPSCAGPARAWQENRGSSRLIESERVSAVPPELVAACRSASLGVLGLAGHLGGMIGGVSGGRSSKPILIPACVVPVLPGIVVGRDVASRGMWSPDEAGNWARPASTRAGWAVHRDCAVGRSCRARSDASADRSGRGLLPVRRGRRGRLGFAVGRFGFAAGQLAGEPAGPPHPPTQVQVQRCDQHGSHHDRV